MRKQPFEIIPPFFSETELKEQLEYFLKLEWQQDEYNFGGNIVRPKRKTFMYGNDYSYSGQNKKSVPFDEYILAIKEKIEKQLNLEKGYFNGCLLNLYLDGEASISYHKDDEEDMDENAIIVSLTIGQKRKFYFQHDDKTKKDRVKKYEVKNGDLLIMYPEAQKFWKHSIPKEKTITQPRISLTFRKFKTTQEVGKELEL
jgi:alkylated DNA repair dioxygenase AlkB